MTSWFSLNNPSDQPLPSISAIDLAFTEAATARIVVARVQFYPAAMRRAPRAGESDKVAIPLFLACTDRDWDPFDDDARHTDNEFDRAAGMKLPPVEARSLEELRAHEIARIGANTFEIDGTILPPSHVPRSIAGRDDVFLIGAATTWFSLPQRRFLENARYPLLVFRGRAQWAACVVPAWFWNPTAYAQRQHFTSSHVKWPLRLALRFADRLPRKLPWPPYELPS